MREKVLEIASKYFNYLPTKYNSNNNFYDEYVSNEIPGWVFMRIDDVRCYIINDLYYNELENRICTTSKEVTEFMLFFNTQLDDIEKYFIELITVVKKLKLKMELNQIKKDF